MRAAALDVVEIMLVGPEPRLLRELVEGRFVDLQDLGLDEGGLLTELRGNLLHLLLHALVLADAGVLVGDEAGVDEDLLQILADAVYRVEGIRETSRGGAERPFERGDFRDLLEQPVLRGAPRLVGRVQVGEIPLVLVVDPGAVPLLRVCDQTKGQENENGQECAGANHDRRIAQWAAQWLPPQPAPEYAETAVGSDADLPRRAFARGQTPTGRREAADL